MYSFDVHVQFRYSTPHSAPSGEQATKLTSNGSVKRPVVYVTCNVWAFVVFKIHINLIRGLFGSTPDRQQSKTFLTIDVYGSKVARNSAFGCHLSPVGRQMTIEDSVSSCFDLRSSTIVLTCSIAAFLVWVPTQRNV